MNKSILMLVASHTHPGKNCTINRNISSMRGALIVLEGCDRAGKSTQCRKLTTGLSEKGILADTLHFPDRNTPIGKLISNYLSNTSDCQIDDKAIHLLFAANRWEFAESIKRNINDGVTLIVDRYSYSGIAYSAVKPGMSMEWCRCPENGLPKPDRVFLLNINLELVANRPDYGKERYENQTTQKSVMEMYNKLKDDTWRCVDASGSVDQVFTVLMSDALSIIHDVKHTALGELKF